MNPLEVWAGIECTVNRVGDAYFDQCGRSGHDRRPVDLDRFAELGIRALRCPFLWETVAPSGLETADWAAADRKLERLKRLNLRTIAGLVHHGSGPRTTSLLDPSFAEGLAAYAGAFARRYPWVEDYTPVNEPLTTARFSTLYGVWYPHHRDDRSFVRAVVHQCRATILAMEAIRSVNSHARLIQTDDMGVTYAPPSLKYQADLENERRWLAFDLIAGKVGPSHPLIGYLRAHGLTDEELGFFAERATPPDIVGLNYYVTSDRSLDKRTELFPARYRGGNGRDAYADIESVRVRPEGITGHRAILDLAHRRYGLPVAFTEVHLGCSREEQLRWLREAWTAACEARLAGIDVRGVTVWSLLGAFDWNSLVTREAGFYEPGPFDVRGAAEPRATALARMTKSLAARGAFDHPVLEAPGWWRRVDRLGAARASESVAAVSGERPVAIVGASGTLGQAFMRLCRSRGLNHVLLNRSEMDIANPESVAAALDRHQPWAVVNAAGYVRVDEAEGDEVRCFRENAEGPAVLARRCRRGGVRLLTFSSDLVFGGDRDHPYEEKDAPGPLSVYGRSKHEAERRVLDELPESLVVRTSAFFGPWDIQNFLFHAIAAAGRREAFLAASDVTVSPTYVPDLVHACLDLLIDEEQGIWHLANPGRITWADFARRGVEACGLDGSLVKPAPVGRLGLRARRPRFSALGSCRASLLGPLEEALARFLEHRRPAA